MPAKIQDMTSWGPLGGPTTRPSSLLDPASSPPSGGVRSGFESGLDRSTQQHGEGPEGWTTATTDIGKRVDNRRWELHVVCDAGEAMRLQFDATKVPFIALHDIGSATSRRFLSGVAAAMQTYVRTLTIRRQGYGDVLASIEYIDLPTLDERTRSAPLLRLYSTSVRDATDASTKHLAEVLMGRSHLAIVMIAGDAAPQHVAVSLATMKDSMTRSAWSNRNVLLMPLRPIDTLAAQTARMGTGKKIDIRIAPQVVRPLDAWNYLRSTWNLLQREGAENGESRIMLLGDPTQANNSVATARRAARIAERVATGRATADELREHLEGPIVNAAREPETTVDVPPVIDVVRTVTPSFHGSDLRPLMVETVPRAPSWSQTQAAALESVLHVPALAPAPPTAPPAPVQVQAPALAQSQVAREAAPSRQHPPAWPSLADRSAAPAAPATTSAPPESRKPVAPRTAPAAATSAASAGPIAPAALQQFLEQCAQIKGMEQCAVVDIATRALVAGHGLKDGASFASDATRLSNALRAAAIALGFASRLPEASLSYDDHHIVLRPLPHDERLAIIGILHKKDDVNTVVVQLKLQRLAATLLQPSSMATKTTLTG